MTTMRAHSRARRLLTISLGVLAATTCSVLPSGTAAAAATVPTGLERFYLQKLTWGSCAPFAYSAGEKKAFPDPSLDCAQLQVPLDYAKPTGRTAQIAVLRHRTNWPKIGSLVINPGGPGVSGLDAAVNIGFGQSAAPFDVVGFDPRGVGASVPAVHCLNPDPQAGEAGSDNGSAADPAARQEALILDYVRRCERGSGGQDVLANVGTRDVARDLDVLRAALGDPKLTYLGYSYGTRLGATYGEMFPGNVRAMVLDGAVDPTQTAADSRVAQAAGFQHAFDAYARACTGQPDCPLGRDPHATTAAYQALTRPLVTSPLPVAGDRSLYYGDATSATFGALYSPASWPALTKALTALRSHDGKPMLALANAFASEGDDDALQAIHCVDDDRITDRAAAAALARKVAAAEPFADPGIPPIAALDVCGLWPVPPTSTPHLPHADGLPPTLVISTTGDPATPYTAGVRLAYALHSHLLTVVGTQHTAAGQGNPCVDQIMATYLVDLTLPAAGARCTIPAGPATGA